MPSAIQRSHSAQKVPFDPKGPIRSERSHSIQKVPFDPKGPTAFRLVPGSHTLVWDESGTYFAAEGGFTAPLLQAAAYLFHCGQEAAGADQALGGFQVAVQGAVATEGANMLAQVAVGGLRSRAGHERLVKL